MSKKVFTYLVDDFTTFGEFRTIKKAVEAGLILHPRRDIICVDELTYWNEHDFVNMSSVAQEIRDTSQRLFGYDACNYLDDLVENSEKIDELNKMVGNWLHKNYPIKLPVIDCEGAMKFSRKNYKKEINKFLANEKP